MVRQLRGSEKTTGLVLANGGWLTYQHAVCLSSQPRSSAYPSKAPLPEVITDVPVPELVENTEGAAVIEVNIHPPQSPDLC